MSAGKPSTDEAAAARAHGAFTERFGVAPEGVWAAPGRVNVIGEHTDYNDGYVLPVALPHTTRAAVGRRTDGRVAFVSLQGDADPVELPVDELAPGRPRGWAGYPAGVVEGLRDRLAGGVSVLVDTDVPVGAGLSSSAALTCSVALALGDLVAPELGRLDLVELARRSENDFVGAPTGILDQSASLLCTAGHALFLDTRQRRTEQVPLDLAAAGLELLVVDTGTSHTHAEGGYGDRRRECEDAAARLRVAALRDVPDVASLAPLEDHPLLLRRARHIVTENARVLRVVDILRDAGDPRRIGPVLTEGHISLRDDFQISTVELDACVEAAVEAGAHGARMVGGGFGGSVVVLVDRDRAGLVADAVAERFARDGYAAPRTFDVVPSAGARRLV
ncbi:galactokinase [Blastococcus deserti]|uniref:Galactokinase n=1 Tax=Blastococcus deserti TaxID=2259033 RepID=A0ABW4XA03_9ACTN